MESPKGIIMTAMAPEEVRFSDNVTIIIQAIQASVKQVYQQGITTIDPNTIQLIAVLISNFDKHHLIQGFIENSHEFCWDKIKARDEDFFINNVGSIFRYLPAEKVNLFKDLYLAKDENGKNVVSDDLKNQIWRLFDANIKISIKYCHRLRSPYSIAGPDGTVRNMYAASFFDEVKLEHHAKVWGVNREFPPRC